ncbi:MAG: fibronectin type III domain-containing protein [Oscillospiraceae bacterium]|nr:fibronectin type III domain-containing protein [Oscillospiraceae bacterium]
MDFNTQRKIVKKLREKGKNPLLFIPCLIAACAVVLFMSVCRAVDMALSDSEGNFLGIKRTRKVKRYPAAVPVPMPSESSFISKKSVKKSPLPFRPLWQRAMSLLLACAFVTMSAEITASAETIANVADIPFSPSSAEITAQELIDFENINGKISEADLYTNYRDGDTFEINRNVFTGNPYLTTVTLGYSTNMVINNNFSEMAPDSSIFVVADNEDDFNDAREKIGSVSNTNTTVIWDKDKTVYNNYIPENVNAASVKAYSGVGGIILKWDSVTNVDNYKIYRFNKKYTAEGKASIVTSGSECSAVITGGVEGIYAVRAYNEYSDKKIFSRQFANASQSAKTLTAGAPKLTTTMSNRTVTVNISMDLNKYSMPSYIILFCEDEGEYGFSAIEKILPSQMPDGTYSKTFDDNQFMGESVRSYVAVAYYDVFDSKTNNALSQFEYHKDPKDNTVEFTEKPSNVEKITDAVLNSPSNLDVILSPDKNVWTLTWTAPDDTSDIDITYEIYANKKLLDSTKNITNKKISISSISGDEWGKDIVFSVIARADGMTSGEAVSKTVEVSKESVQLVKLKGGNEKAEIIFKPFGTDKNTRYTIWGKEASDSNDKADIIGGKEFTIKALADCTKNSDGTYSYTISGLTNDVKYYFWITSSAENCNYPSLIKSVTPSEAPQPPENIIGKGLENSAVITWDPVLKDDGSGNYADGYYVSVYKLGVSAPVINRVKCTEYTYTAGKLENDVEYYAEVSAYTIVNDSEIEGPSARSATFIPTITVGDVLNLTVTPSGKVINISWTAVKGASEYILLRTDPDGAQREIYKGSQSSYVDSNVDNKTEYSYRVMAVRKVDGKDYAGEYSSEQKGMINYVLSSVQGLTATGGDGCIILKWDKVDGADGYYVQYSIPDANSWTTIANVGKTTFTHTGLANDVVYDYRVIPYVTINNKEESADTYAQKVEGKSGINLPAPADFTVTAGDGQITLKWTAVKGAEGYNIYLVGYDGSKYLLDQVSKTTAIHTNLTNDTTFTYTVCAYKYVDGVLVKGDYAAYKTATVGVELNAPTDVVAKAGKEQVSLSWKKSDGAEGYVIYSYNIASMSFTPVGIVTKTSFVHTGLIGGREYTYMIAAYKNVNGSVIYSGYSMAVTAIPESSGNNSSSGDNSNAEAGDYRIFITGTTPFGMSNSDLISAFAGKGAFNTDIDVRFTLSPDTVTSVQNVLNFYGEGIDSFLIYPMDISIYVAGTNTRATINEGQYLTLTIPVPDELLPYSEHISVVHVSDLNQLEILPSIHVNVGGVDCMQFTANSFSPYAFVVYLPEIGEDTGAGTPVTAQGTNGSSGQTAVFSFRNTYLPAIYRRRARNKLYRIVRR